MNDLETTITKFERGEIDRAHLLSELRKRERIARVDEVKQVIQYERRYEHGHKNATMRPAARHLRRVGELLAPLDHPPRVDTPSWL